MARSTIKRAKGAIRSYRCLDPLFQPIYRRWHKSLEIDGHTHARTALSCHLSTLFWECIRSRPNLVVELGVRNGESTKVLCEAAQHYGGTIVSADVEPVTFLTQYPRWHFFQERSQALGRRFEDVRADLRLGPVDMLFLDSSHIYTETVEELKAWLPHLSATGMLISHDTAMGSVYRACDGTLRRGWNNERGVTRALEEALGVEIDERSNFVTKQGDWAISHTPLSSGLTMLTPIR